MIPRRIRVISFDAGGTLLAPWPSVGSVYAAGAKALGLGDCDPQGLNARFAVAWRRARDFDYSRAAWSGVVADWSFWLSMMIGREKEMKGIKRGPAAEAGWGVGFYS